MFVTGLITTLRDDELRELFQQHGDVEQASVVRDPHSRESRGFGFVNMMTPEDADAVIEKLQGFELHGRAISVEKAKRNRPRTPTPGRYQGPPKRGMFTIPVHRSGRKKDLTSYVENSSLTTWSDMRRGGGFGGGDRRDDRRGPPRDDYRGGGGYPRSGDRYSGDRYSSRDGDRRGDRGGDRGGDRRYRDRTDGYSSRGESYGGGGRRDDRDRYAGGDSRGGGGGGGYGYREPAGDYGGPPPPRPAYEERR